MPSENDKKNKKESDKKYCIHELCYDDYNNGFLELLEELTIVNKKNISFENFKKRLDETNNKIYLIKDNNKIIGTGSLLIEKKFIHQLGNVAHIEDLVIKKEYRNKKLGSLLINKLINEAKKYNCYKILLNCSDNNINFYKKFGFINKDNNMALYIS